MDPQLILKTLQSLLGQSQPSNADYVSQVHPSDPWSTPPKQYDVPPGHGYQVPPDWSQQIPDKLQQIPSMLQAPLDAIKQVGSDIGNYLVPEAKAAGVDYSTPDVPPAGDSFHSDRYTTVGGNQTFSPSNMASHKKLTDAEIEQYAKEAVRRDALANQAQDRIDQVGLQQYIKETYFDPKGYPTAGFGPSKDAGLIFPGASLDSYTKTFGSTPNSTRFMAPRNYYGDSLLNAYNNAIQRYNPQAYKNIGLSILE